MKIKYFIYLIIVYLISIILLNSNINFLYPYYLIKDIIFFPVNAIDNNIEDSKDLKKGIEIEKNDELEELKKLNNISSTLTDFDKVSAVVIERNRMYWFNTITINKGYSSGIKENMAVVSGDGLIGRVFKVSSKTSEIKLLTTNDINHKISVMIKLDNDNLYGILTGYDNNSNRLEITSINKEFDNLDNSLVYTSGMGGIFPSGIIIGKVKGIKKDKYDVSKIIEVEPASNFNNLKFVNVLIRK